MNAPIMEGRRFRSLRQNRISMPTEAEISVSRLGTDIMASESSLRRKLLEAGYHVKLVDTVAYWRSLHRRGQLPTRADIDPAQIRTLLPCLALLDAQTPDGTPRYRLAGTGVVELFGQEPTGRPVAAIKGPLRDFLLDSWDDLNSLEMSVLDHESGLEHKGGRLATFRDDDAQLGSLYRYEGAFLPLSGAGGARVLLCLLRRFISDATSSVGRNQTRLFGRPA